MLTHLHLVARDGVLAHRGVLAVLARHVVPVVTLAGVYATLGVATVLVILLARLRLGFVWGRRLGQYQDLGDRDVVDGVVKPLVKLGVLVLAVGLAKWLEGGAELAEARGLLVPLGALCAPAFELQAVVLAAAARMVDEMHAALELSNKSDLGHNEDRAGPQGGSMTLASAVESGLPLPSSSASQFSVLRHRFLHKSGQTHQCPPRAVPNLGASSVTSPAP